LNEAGRRDPADPMPSPREGPSTPFVVNCGAGADASKTAAVRRTGKRLALGIAAVLIELSLRPLDVSGLAF
jgi:hypothetical protein